MVLQTSISHDGLVASSFGVLTDNSCIVGDAEITLMAGKRTIEICGLPRLPR